MSSDCRDCVLCPFGKSCTRRQITRPGLFVHLTSKAHREQLKEKLEKRSTIFLRDTSRSAPYFEAEDGYISFCFGCQKAWTTQKPDHFPGCKGHAAHLEKMKQLLADVSGNEAGAEALNAEQSEKILAQEKEIAQLKKELAKVKKEYADFEECAQEDSDNCQLYWGWLRTIIGDPDRGFHTTGAFKEVAEEIAAGERKSLWELSQAPPSAPPPPPPPPKAPEPAAPFLATPAAPRLLATTVRRLPKQLSSSS